MSKITSVVCLVLLACLSAIKVQANDWWQPEQSMGWQIQLQGKVNRAFNIKMYDIDLFDTPQATINILHARGAKVVCYLSAGSYEAWRNDSDKFPAEVLGEALQKWLGENWVDIRQLDVLVPIIEARLDLAKAKHCDAVDFDNVDGFVNNTGFPLTAEDQLNFNQWLANAVHMRGLAAGLRNDANQVLELGAYFDFAITETCQITGECALFEPFVRANKPVFAIEYVGPVHKVCTTGREFGFNTLIKHRQLDAWRYACRSRNG